MKIPVRATRSYLAGFGTSGSILAGAVVLFILGSAIVAFSGWPQIATGPATVSVAAAHPAAPSRVARRLAAVLKAGHLTSGGAATAGLRRRVARSVKSVVVRRGNRTPSSPGGVAAPATGSSAGGATAPCATGGCNQPDSPGLVASLTNKVAQEVSSIGAGVGSGVSSGSSAVGGTLNGASPQAGGAIQSAGNSAGSGVSGTATTAGSTIMQVGNAVGGGH
jgi:hypothetical protein